MHVSVEGCVSSLGECCKCWLRHNKDATQSSMQIDHVYYMIAVHTLSKLSLVEQASLQSCCCKGLLKL